MIGPLVSFVPQPFLHDPVRRKDFDCSLNPATCSTSRSLLDTGSCVGILIELMLFNVPQALPALVSYRHDDGNISVAKGATESPC